MSESNSLVKLFNDIMKGMDDDDEKKVEQFTPEGVPAMIASPPMPEEVTPRVEENQTVRQKQEEYYLDTLGGLDPRQLRSANSIRAEITGPNNNNRVVPALQQPVRPVEQPPVKDPGFVEKALASAGLPSTDSMKRKASEELSRFGNAFSSPEAFGRQLASSFSLPGEVVKGAVKRGTDLTAATVEAVGDPVVRFGQGFAGTDVTGIEKGSFGRYYPEEQTEEQLVIQPSEEAEEQLVIQPSEEAKEKVNKKIKLPNPESKETPTEEELNTDPEKKQSFLSKIWNGVKDVVGEQFQDPANQRALFAYAVSRALGYDGVTFATQVLADSYEAKAAQQKQDHERQQKILDKELDFKYDMMGKVFDAQLEGNLKAGEKKIKIFKAIEARAKGARENAIKNAISANPNLDEKEVSKRLNNVLNDSTIFSAVSSFADQYGNTPGFSEFTTAPAIEAGIASFAQQVAIGKAKAKDLAAHFEFQRLALSQTPAVSANLSTVHDSEEVVSNDEWSRASGQVSRITGRLESQMQTQAGVAGKANKAKVWSALEIEYNRQIQERGDSFAKYWQNISKQSLTKNGRQTSPALAWINSIGKPGDVAEPQFYPGDYNTVINNMFGKR